MQNERLGYLRDKCKKLPLDPGVYIMRDKKGKIIYIGKAKALKKRVSSYFRSIEKHLPKVYQTVMHIYDFDYIVTESEFEALVLECSLIKQYTPKYNILLKDDKGYSYIKISNDEYPRITEEKRKDNDGIYIGPYTSSFVVKETVEQIVKSFMLPTCNRNFSKEVTRARPCLRYHIKQCMAPCRGNISVSEYCEIIEQAKKCIKDGSSESVIFLTKLMNEAAENLEFEKAARLRDRISALKKITEQQKVFSDIDISTDALGFSQDGERIMAVILKFRNGKLHDKVNYELEEMSAIEEARSQVLMQYYTANKDIPKRILIDGECEDIELIERYIQSQATRKIELHIPKKGELLKIVNMSVSNATQKLSESGKTSAREITALEQLAKLLGLSSPPQYIEAYDISNFGSSTIVGGMVVFENGKPLKSAYKKFKIDQFEQDDYAAMKNVISRRFSHYEEDKETQIGFGRMPDLILLDGGSGHLAAVAPLIHSFGLSVPVFGMVKDNRHRTRAVAANGGEIAINANKAVFDFITSIQDEVHRFSINYSRKKHSSKAFKSSLTDIYGVGEKKAKALLKHFKTLTAIKNASVNEIQNVQGMTEGLAKKIYDFYHS